MADRHAAPISRESYPKARAQARLKQLGATSWKSMVPGELIYWIASRNLWLKATSSDGGATYLFEYYRGCPC